MAHSGWNPLAVSLLTSSVLGHGPDVLAVWTLLMASADRHGHTDVSASYMADALRVDIARVDAALEVLASPDPRSRNKDQQGRRIVPGDGGYYLVSHAKYRALANKAKAAQRQARYAERKKLMQLEDQKDETGRLSSKLRPRWCKHGVKAEDGKVRCEECARGVAF